jgi:hypothetical protein
MASSCKTLLTISCVSFSLCAMEQDTTSLCKAEQNTSSTTTLSSIMQAKYNPKNYHALNSLYNTTKTTLSNYNSRDKQSITNVFQIIDAITKLETNGCEEIEGGRFAYRQHLHQPNAPMPLYISLVLERIAEHKAHMKKNEFCYPTLNELIEHMRVSRTKAAVENATTYRLIIINKVNQDTAKSLGSHNITPNGLSESENLIHDIEGLLKMNQEFAKINADLIYGLKL